MDLQALIMLHLVGLGSLNVIFLEFEFSGLADQKSGLFLLMRDWSESTQKTGLNHFLLLERLSK